MTQAQQEQSSFLVTYDTDIDSRLTPYLQLPGEWVSDDDTEIFLAGGCRIVANIVIDSSVFYCLVISENDDYIFVERNNDFLRLVDKPSLKVLLSFLDKDVTWGSV